MSQRTFCDYCQHEITTGTKRLIGPDEAHLGLVSGINVTASLSESNRAATDVCRRCIADVLRVVANQIDDRAQPAKEG